MYMKKIFILVSLVCFSSMSHADTTSLKKFISDGVKVVTKTVQVIDEGYSQVKEAVQSEEVQSQLDSLKTVGTNSELFQDTKQAIKTVSDTVQTKMVSLYEQEVTDKIENKK